MPQVWSTNTLGGYMYSDQLSEVLRTALQPMVRFRQFCDIQEGKGQSSGDRLYWNVYSDVQNPGQALNENNVMPETQFTIRQESLVVTEYGNSVNFSEKLDDLSKHSVTQVINKVLRNDARTVLDGVARTQFAATPLTVTPAGAGTAGNSTTAIVIETTGTPTRQNQTPLNTAHVKLISDAMKERNIIPFNDGEHYMALGRPSAFRPIKNELESVYRYVDQGFGLIYNGEIGRYEGMRFVEQTSVPSRGWVQGMSDEIFFFGGDTVAEGIVIPEEIRGKIPTDYGRSRGIAWYYLGGFGICHTAPAYARILRWASGTATP